ncbi:hypothetical protein CVT26_012910 [Gymnopilus dilepis]|uniref:Uncharacterized protein n=1 Tax=Gymnopilus dilepis TaxID=231916 RepID=A0A409X0G7_9AGAR|nr:hypothetical protein CVT26_012910 [Gymnopilus dilepis]
MLTSDLINPTEIPTANIRPIIDFIAIRKSQYQEGLKMAVHFSRIPGKRVPTPSSTTKRTLRGSPADTKPAFRLLQHRDVDLGPQEEAS